MAQVTIELIQKLRERTGAGMMDCKKALTDADGDIEKAIDILRKKGAATAAKRSERSTAEGIVHAYIHPGDRIGVMVEINCETDFVARTDDLRKFAADICLHIAALKPIYVSPADVDQAFLAKEKTFFKEQLVGSGKPEKIIDQIVEGKINKLYSDICLMQQPFVKNDQMTVDDVRKEVIAKTGENIIIKRFSRFEIGA